MWFWFCPMPQICSVLLSTLIWFQSPQIFIFPFSACSYRFTLDDLYPMMNAVKQRAEFYDEWASHVTETLEAKLDKKKSER